ncbi:GDSL esterase/lipase 7-like [Prosopis cineraria]|uniref:GDSL esterase/lipase 7-like n=1 Tax=Prosopis cineraria TaxID=364024 RepID=UPI00240FD625|nr:GDSL esterase/lipase 7-like [Prosopis cineraria]
MENSVLFFLLSFCFVANQVLITNVNGDEQHRLVSALYVFGDSHVDAGNNAHLNTPAQANRWPYGIDLYNITGRFTNGKNMADFIATYLDLPMPPAYLNLTDFERSQITTGISYASGACGILNTTGVGECLTLSKQVGYFTSTVTKDLPKAINDKEKLQKNLANSLYLVLIGNNDYSERMSNKNVTNKYCPQDYADYLLNETSGHIKTLYELGARKFVVLGISTCGPQNYTKGCESRYYVDKLPQRLQKLQSELFGSIFTIYDVYKVYNKITGNPQKYGITNTQEPCYVDHGPVCPDRSKYLKFDQYSHQTQVAYEIAAKECFSGTACSPYTISQLAKASIINH